MGCWHFLPLFHTREFLQEPESISVAIHMETMDTEIDSMCIHGGSHLTHATKQTQACAAMPFAKLK